MDKQIPLGQATDYVFTYNPDVLFAVPRSETRQALGLGQNLPFTGVDVWTAYEVSWLDGQGMPQVAIAEFIFPCESPNLVESKSFKLYLNSFNQTQFTSEVDVISCMQKDLSACCGAEVLLKLLPVTH
jgi:7-cyano-7-deazaguanine reductase